MSEYNGLNGDIPDIKITRQEQEKVKIDLQLRAYNEALNYSKTPFIFILMFLGVDALIWLIYTIYANPSGVKPLYDGLSSVLMEHLVYVFNQTFFFLLLPFALVFFIVSIVYSRHRLPTENELRHKMIQGEDITSDVVNTLQKRGKRKRIITIILFVMITAVTLPNISLGLKEILIYDGDDLLEIDVDNSSNRIVLMNDIIVDGTLDHFIKEFTGVFEGNGHTIYNLELNEQMFSENYGVIANVHFENLKVNGQASLSALTRVNYGTIQNVSFNLVTFNLNRVRFNDYNGRISVFSQSNYGVIKDVSMNHIEYTFMSSIGTGNYEIDLSGITMTNSGVISNAYVSPYEYEDNQNIRYLCLITCDPVMDYGTIQIEEGSANSNGILINSKVDTRLLDVYADQDFLDCLNCMEDFNLRNQMIDTPKIYWQIRYYEES